MAGFTLIPRRRRGIKMLAYDPTGRLLASIGSNLLDVDLTWWDAELAVELRTVPGGRGHPIALQFDATGERLLVACDDLRVFAISTGFETHRIRRAPHDGAVTSAAISPDGAFVASSGAGAIVVHRIDTGVEVMRIPLSTDDSSRGWLLAFSADGARVAAQVHDAICIWDIATGVPLRSVALHQPLAIGLGSTRELCALIDRDGALVRFDLEAGTEHVVGELAAPIDRVVLDSASGGIAATDKPPSLTRRFTLDPATNQIVELERPAGARTPTLWTWDSDGAAWHADFPMPDNFAYHAASRRFAYDDNFGLSVLGVHDGWSRRHHAPWKLSPPRVELGPDPRWLMIGGYLLDLRDPDGPTFGRRIPLDGPLRFSVDGHWFAGMTYDRLAIVELGGARTMHRSPHMKQVDQLVVSADGAIVFAIDDVQLLQWRTGTGTTSVVRTLPERRWSSPGPALRCAPDRRHVLLDTGATIEVFDLTDGRSIVAWPEEAAQSTAWATADVLVTAARGADDARHLVITERSISNAFAPRVRTLQLPGQVSPVSMAVTPGGHLVVAQRHSVVLAERIGERATFIDGALLAIGPGDEVWTMQTIAGQTAIAHATFDDLHSSPTTERLGDVTLIPAAGWLLELDDCMLHLRSAETLELVATLLVTKRFAGGQWDFVVATPAGLFDGTLPGWRNVRLRFGDALLDVADPDRFFADFYVPGLFTQLWRRDPLQSRELAAVDRRSPRVTMLRYHDADVPPGYIGVELRVAEAPPDDAHPTGSGARDLRLYRYAFCVAAWHGDLLGGASTAAFRALVRVNGSSCEVVAHAYNRANVKGTDAQSTMSPVERRDSSPVLHVLAIGIDRYAEQRPLACAVADAHTIASSLDRAVATYGPSLGLGDPAPTCESVVTATLVDEQATKHTILAALARLAGRDTPQLPASCAALRGSGPSDIVIVTFAGHGMRVGPRFYLVPQDTRRGAAGTDPTTAISDLELESAFADIDAESIVLVIDACYSGAALDSDEPRRGFLNMRSLAQLAFEKNMIVLAAAQATEAALEQSDLGQGLLTYALIREGLEAGRADCDPDDGVLRLGELLRYAADRVPSLEAERWGAARDILDAHDKRLDATTQRPRVYLSSHDLEDIVIARRRYDVLSEPWFRRLEATAALLDSTQPRPPPAIILNAIATTGGLAPIEFAVLDDLFVCGRRSEALATITLPLQLARAVLIQRDRAAAAAAISAGDLVLDGDPQHLDAWLTAPSTPLAQRIAAITR